jgi:hypothetical protein
MKSCFQLWIGAYLACTSYAFDTGGANDITAVSGRTSKDYVRVKEANGSFAPESYMFANGGVWSGAMKDASIDKVTFLNVAHTIAYPLANQNYIPSKEPKTAKLLIMVYWGTTRAPEDATESGGYVNLQKANGTLDTAQTMMKSAMASKDGEAMLVASKAVNQADDQLTSAMAMVTAENRKRDEDDFTNVKLLGYDSWWESTQGDKRGTAMAIERQDLLDEIEENRYFVILMAYDFQLLWKEKKHNLLWETRFSIRQRHHDFDKDLPAMAQFASQYFGQDSDGLVHKAIPLGRVEIGDVKSLGPVPDK